MQHKRGFTLIELLVTLSIMAVLGLAATPLLQVAVQRDKERELRLALMQVREGLDAYKRAAEQGRIVVKLGDSGYPKSLEELEKGVPDQRSLNKQNLYFLRRLPRDPMASDASVKAEDTWGLRRYASPPDEPASGADVFDVYSKSEKLGLNGVPYAKW